MFGCKHNWVVLSEVTTKSKFETAIEVIRENTDSKATIPHQMCDITRKHIVILACKECGDTKRFVENI